MTDGAAERQRVRALIERAGVAMLMNVDERDTHVGRPMLPLFIQDEGEKVFRQKTERVQGSIGADHDFGLPLESARQGGVIGHRAVDLRVRQ